MIDRIYSIFKGKKGHISGQYRKYAVIILLTEKEGKMNILLEVRSFRLRTQPGDICLPGGTVENGENPKEAAIREAVEELKVDYNDIEFIGEMNYLVSPYGFIMYPFVAKLKTENYSYSEDEVDHVFTVPVDFLIKNKPKLYELTLLPHLEENFPYELINGGKSYKFRHGKAPEYFYIYGDYVIWGFTALILKNFVDTIVSDN
ncbi:CoA pyrophosphatase [Clostridium fermenticellae]|uniref:CoA pyrophosphatase n=1 Tax=Clostridium fermenticellae TaxID=2068654 RepID=A0A386H415_9CLOT|nr:CoA pyrophosphatase [Clostridium fermenticellae]AYD40442.1 CoA pyrophosphatase [Clostridium fermenticellae]